MAYLANISLQVLDTYNFPQSHSSHYIFLRNTHVDQDFRLYVVKPVLSYPILHQFLTTIHMSFKKLASFNTGCLGIEVEKWSESMCLDTNYKVIKVVPMNDYQS